MEVEVFLHGVPRGQDFFGLQDEQHQHEIFYTRSNESVKLVVEVKRKGATPYVYYNYLRYNGILGAAGRPGSYLGITLRLDMFYPDIQHIFRMLDMAFNKYVVGTIVTKNADTYQYTSPDFSTKKQDIERLQQGVLEMLQATCVEDKFIKIEDSLVNPITTSPECHIDDATEGTTMATIKRYSRIVISPDIKSHTQKEIDKKLKDVDSAIEEAVADKLSTIATLNSAVSSRDSRISSLEKELEEYKSKSDMVVQVDDLKEPITALANYFRVQNNDANTDVPQYGKKNHTLALLNVCLLVVVLVVVILSSSMSGVGGESVEKAKYDALDLKYKSLEKKNQRLEALKDDIWNELDAVTKKKLEDRFSEQEEVAEPQQTQPAEEVKKEELKKEEPAKPAQKPEEPKATVETPAAAGSVKIVVKDNVKAVEIGHSYTFSVEGYTGNGTWRADGFVINNRSENSSTVTATAIEKQDDPTADAVISFTPENGEKVKMTLRYKK
jgi:hypothetical protein